MVIVRRRFVFSAAASAAALCGLLGAAQASARAVDVCDEAARSIGDIKDAMQPFVDAVAESVENDDGSEARQIAVGKVAWRARETLLVAASRVDSANSLDDAGEVTERGNELVGVMTKLANAVNTGDYTNVEPVIDEYNDAMVAMMNTCQAQVVGSGGDTGDFTEPGDSGDDN